MHGTRIWTLLVAVVATVVLPATPSEARPQQVDVEADRFTPAEVRVDVEETVRWVIRENHHTITSDDGLFDSGRAGPGSIFVARFHNAGRFAYYCTIHGGPGGEGMSGVVIVGESERAAKPSAAPSTTTTTRTTTSPPPPTATTTTTTTATTASPAPLPPATPLAAAGTPPPNPPASTSPPAGQTSTSTTSATTSTTMSAPETPASSAPPAAVAAPDPAPMPPRTSDPVTADLEDRDLYRIDRKALQRRLTSSAGTSGDSRGNDALVVGGTLLAVAGMVLVVPGWRTRRG